MDVMIRPIMLVVAIACCLSATSVESKTKSKTKASAKKIDTTPNYDSGDIYSANIETNIYHDTLYVSPSWSLSLNNGWDFQFSSYNIPLMGGGAQNYEFDSYVTIAKTFDLSDTVKLMVGTQNGSTLFTEVRQLHNVDYVLMVYQKSSYNIHAGPFWANKALTTTTDYLGYTIGFSVDVVPNKITFQGDYFSGHNNVSGGVLNIMYRIIPKMQVYTGVGIPESDSGNEYYGIIGLNLTSKFL